MPFFKYLSTEFQSTSSVWRTTRPGRQCGAALPISIHVLRVEDDATTPTWGFLMGDFNPRPPCGGRPKRGTLGLGLSAISIHVLRVEDDALCPALPGGARLISIHVLRVEDDGPRPARAGLHQHFNPRPPCGGRLRLRLRTARCKQFQSTSSVWRTTHARASVRRMRAISIHVLRVEDDSKNREKSLFAFI